MHYIQHIPSSKLLRRLLIIILVATHASAFAFQAGDEVALTRDEVLRFRDEEFRQGKAEEKFIVLAHRPELKKVFMSTTGKGGEQIAVSIPDDAVKLVAVDTSKLRKDAEATANAGKFADALKAIDQALRSNPTDVSLQQMRTAIVRWQGASDQLRKAQESQKRAVGEAAKLRRNAGVVDRPNPLKPADTSNQQRAEEMRAQADEVEKFATRALETAENELASAKASFSSAEVGSAAGERPTSASQPGIEMAPSPLGNNRPVATTADAGGLKRDALKEWLEDKAIVPAKVASGSWDPSYEETLQFINERISPYHMKLWFGENAGRMILDHQLEVFVFDPAVLSTDIKIHTSTYAGFEQRQVVVSKRSGMPEFIGIPAWGDAKPKSAEAFTLPSGDSVEAEKLAKALQHLIRMFGGKKDLF